ncbi:MAG: hypothetical protein ACKKL5_00025 [Candidatus Komeilibacteria bacterium]
MLNWLRKNFIWCLLTILILGLFAWQLQKQYLNRLYGLENLLPHNTALQAHLDLSELNATINQKNKLGKNPLISDLATDLNVAIANYLSAWQINWGELSQQYLDPKAIFYITATNNYQWGVLVSGRADNIIKALKNEGIITPYQKNGVNFWQMNNNDNIIYLDNITKNLLSVSENEQLIINSHQAYQSDELSGWNRFSSIISLRPLLTIKINQFLDDDLLANNHWLKPFYNIWQPLWSQGENNALQIEINQSGDYLWWQIANSDSLTSLPTFQTTNINSLAEAIHLPAIFSWAAADSQNWSNATSNNDIVNYLWQLHKHGDQSSLWQLILKLNGPKHISLLASGEILIVVPSKIIDDITYVSRNILAKNKAKQVTKTLPDGGEYTELVADYDAIISQKFLYQGQSIITWLAPGSKQAISYYQSGDNLLIANDKATLINNLDNKTINQICGDIPKYNNALIMKTDQLPDDWIFELHPSLRKIKEIAIFSQKNEKSIIIKGCLQLR